MTGQLDRSWFDATALTSEEAQAQYALHVARQELDAWRSQR